MCVAAVKRLMLLAIEDFVGLALLFAVSSLQGHKNEWLPKTLV